MPYLLLAGSWNHWSLQEDGGQAQGFIGEAEAGPRTLWTTQDVLELQKETISEVKVSESINALSFLIGLLSIEGWVLTHTKWYAAKPLA